jgi:hypothetical protein
MLDFEVQRCTRHCAKSDRELKPGETFYSMLVVEDGAVVRHDFCQEAWDGPAEDALGWWKSQMPDPNAKRLHWAPNDVMLHYFEQLASAPEKQDVRYVLALLMIRRRVVRLEETEEDEQGQEVLILYCPKKEAEYKVPVVDPTPQRIGVIQEELAQLLFANAG